MDRILVDRSGAVEGPSDGFRSDADWLAVVTDEIPVGELYEWAIRDDCGAVVLFSGTIRNHSSDGNVSRRGVQFIEYEAYASEAVARLRSIAASARDSWPNLGRIGIVHRIGRVAVGESSVVVAVSAPHRPEAFEAARFAIDTLKSSVPIWKHETWEGGSDWGLGATQVSDVPTPDDVDGAGAA